MKKIFLIVFLAVTALSYAQDEEIKLFLGQTHLIPVSSPKRVIIGNPEVIDIAYASKTEVTVTPKQAGTTTLIIWDDLGEQSFKFRVFTEDAQELKSSVDSLLKQLGLPDVYTKIDEVGGKVLLMGSIKCPPACSEKPSSTCGTKLFSESSMESSEDSKVEPPSDSDKKPCPDRERINTILGPLKEKVVDLIEEKEEESVVEIDVQVVELNKDATNTLGFSWPGSIKVTEVGSDAIDAGGSKWSNFFKVLNVNRSAFIWSLEALVQEGKAKILSRPRLACQSGKEAELMVGGERPILTSQVVTSGAASTSVDYKEFGIKLNIKPEVTKDKRIKLALNVEVSEIGNAEVLGEATAPTAKAWPLTKRTASTELILNDQQTLAIGGLIKQKTEEDIRKTPVLGDIPILGALFRRKETKVGQGAAQRGDTELFITLTPTIVLKGKQESAASEEKETQAASGPGLTDTERYAGIIQHKILDNLKYPASAREVNFQGRIKLGLLLSYQGEVLDVAVTQSSGHKTIDDETVSMVKAISPYPPFPPSVESKELWVDIPLDYKTE